MKLTDNKLLYLKFFIVGCVLFLLNTAPVSSLNTPYYGKLIGKLSELHHGVSGEVYAVDGRTLHIKDFTYDGQGPAAYFYVGNTKAPSSGGHRIADEHGSLGVLRRYRKESITLTLPEGKTLNNIKWFSVWCDEYSVNFGDVKIPRNFDYPKPQKIDALNGVHGISSDPIVIVDAQTLLIPNLSYDGEAPDAKFWVGRGSKPSPQGIRVPDENGKELPLRRYDRKTVVLTLPHDLTVFDIGHFGIWCEAFTVDFGHVKIPSNLNVPPSLKMLGISPQSKLNCEVLNDDLAFEVRWAVAGDSIVIQLVSKLDENEYMSFGLSGDDDHSVMVNGDVVVAWVDKQTLKGFAQDYYLDAKSQCSGNHGACPDDRIQNKTNSIRLLNAAMVNGYSIVTYQRTLKPADKLDRRIYTNRSQPILWAVGPLNQRNEVSFHPHYLKKDQFIDFGRQPRWNCPMPESDKPQQRSASTTLNPIVETQSKTRGGNRFKDIEPEVTINSRSGANDRTSERTGDRSGERGVDRSNERGTDRSSERGSTRGTSSRSRTKQTDRNEISRVSSTTARPVPTPKPVAKRDAWEIPPIQCYEPEDGVFYAQMGPTGGKKGYSAITGHVGWGISWYINGLLIPEINVVRGKTYTFVVEGGIDPEIPARYHPFYITDDPVGGYAYKTPEERANVRIFAGVAQTPTGEIYPTGVGRLCNWTPKGDIPPEDFVSFGGYQRTLELICDEGEPGVITWTPDRDTPDTVYYQCFSHRYLGWKINVLDSCDIEPEASEYNPSYVSAPSATSSVSGNVGEQDIFKGSSSVNVETRVKPSEIYLGNSMNNFINMDLYRKNQYYMGYPLNHFHNIPLDFKPSPPLVTTSLLQQTITPNIFKNEAITVVTQEPPKMITTTISTTTDSAPEETTVASNTIVTNETNENNETVSEMITTTTTTSTTTVSSVTNETSTETKLEAVSYDFSKFPNRLLIQNKSTTALPYITIPAKINGNKFSIKAPAFMHSAFYMPKPAHSMGPRFGITNRPPSLNRPIYINPNFSMKKPFYRRPANKRPSSLSTILRPIALPPPKHFNRKPIIMLKPHLPSKDTPTMLQTKRVVPQTLMSLSHQLLINQNHSLKPKLPYSFKKNNTLNATQPEFKPLSVQQNTFSFFTKPEIQVENQPLQDTVINQPYLSFANDTPKNIIPLENVESDPVKITPMELLKLSTQLFEKLTTPIPPSDIQSHVYLHTTKTPPVTPSQMMSIKPDFRETFTTLKPAINTGFHPDSVIIEGGFKPIITKPDPVAQDRIDEEIEPESESDNIGVIDLTIPNPSNHRPLNDFSQQSTETFEPMFIPSPPDSHSEHKLSYTIKNSILPNYRQNSIYSKYISRTDEDQFNITTSLDKNLEDNEMAMAAERVNSYYLPPEPSVKQIKPIQPHQPDIDVPNGSIVTYNGKVISDISLSPTVLPIPLNSSSSSTKIEQLVKNVPQFGVFKGELPPPIPDNIELDSIPQLHTKSNLSTKIKHDDTFDNPLEEISEARLFTPPTIKIKRKRRNTLKRTPRSISESTAESGSPLISSIISSSFNGKYSNNFESNAIK